MHCEEEKQSAIILQLNAKTRLKLIMIDKSCFKLPFTQTSADESRPKTRSLIEESFESASTELNSSCEVGTATFASDMISERCVSKITTI